jgi:hypothetical protein
LSRKVKKKFNENTKELNKIRNKRNELIMQSKKQVERIKNLEKDFEKKEQKLQKQQVKNQEDAEFRKNLELELDETKKRVADYVEGDVRVYFQKEGDLVKIIAPCLKKDQDKSIRLLKGSFQ